ncbi:hypothetical protein DIPPA_23689 [Diplonema papillatum]|nr:hypothetical protein DIPPA_23689 [Diplonema papillatum]
MMVGETSRQALGDITTRANVSPMLEKPALYSSISRMQAPAPALPEPAYKVAAYHEQIMDYLHKAQAATQVSHSHLSICQVEVTDKMRAILVDWLVDVHLKYKCRPETLYLAMNLLDRYLVRQPVEKKRLQLLGCVAMMLACKYEDIMPPEVRDFVHISANTYTRSEILTMERQVLVELEYNLTVPVMWQFLVNLQRLERVDTLKFGAEYLAEQILMCGRTTGYPPAMQAAAAIYLSRRILGVQNVWTAAHQDVSRYYECDLYEIVDVLDDYIKKVPKLRFAAVRKKYSHPRYGGVARKFDAYAEL